MTVAPVHPDMALWRQQVVKWYPDLYQRTHFLPPVHFHRTQHEELQLAWGHPVLVTGPPLSDRPPGGASLLSQSDVRDDQSLQRVLDCLRQLAESPGEVMFVLSELKFGEYLNKPCFAAAGSALPNIPMDKKTRRKQEGDFDVLVIHRQHGILVGEIKAIGYTLSLLPQQQQDQAVNLKKKVEQAIRQLKKAKDVLQHVVSDLQPPPRVQTTLMLPNIARAQLHGVLAGNLPLSQALCQCVGVAVHADPASLCLTSDDVITPGQWWQQRVTGAGTDPAMTDHVYLDLVSRFGGPATTVTVYCSSQPRLARAHRPDVRTAGEGVEETASRFTPVDIVLHPKQVDVLNNQGELVFLTGPPGTGKSLILLCKGLFWVRQQKPVQVVSGWSESLAATHMLHSQLCRTAGPAASHLIHMHHFDLDTDLDAAVETLVKSAQGEQLYVIADEIDKNLTDLCTELQRRITDLHVWSASMHSEGVPPQLTEVILTEPLRTPPSITRYVQRMGEGGGVLGYTNTASPLPCDGPPLLSVLHSGQGHSAGGDLSDCLQCGREVGQILHMLRIGETGRSSSSPQPPRYKDVFILTDEATLHDTERDVSGQETRAASGMVQGVRETGVPVTVLEPRDAVGVRDVATMAGPDHVVAAYSLDVQGLERKVVVFVQTVRSQSGSFDKKRGMLSAISRTTAQLVWVKPGTD
ncbi:uncharacterized protein [Littorina saxatilis]|uniref:uncharacterized protein n=1 Tax=Littorina saxatilis TaxID=31220 RepID=UPI0038B53C6A